MFPCVEEKIKYDDYGEIIRIEDFLMDDSEPVDDVNDTIDDVEDSVPDKEEVPTKCVSSFQNFQINCGIQYIDFEGRIDGESIMKLTTQLRPRRVILVRGSVNSIQAMKSFCHEIIQGDNAVFAPKNGEIVDATTERFIYQVRLRDSLFSTLNFSKAKEDHVTWVDGMVTLAEDDRVDIINSSTTEDTTEVASEPSGGVLPMLVPLHDEEQPSHETNFVNELKLSDFKLVLTKAGIPSEFQQGNLLCGHSFSVQLRRHDSGRVMIEGCLSDDYYVIRNLLYQQYAIV